MPRPGSLRTVEAVDLATVSLDHDAPNDPGGPVVPSDDEDAPKKPEKPKTKRVDKPEEGAKPKKPSGTGPALGADKPKTKKITKEAAAPPIEEAAEAPKGESAKSKTGKRPRPAEGDGGAAASPKKKRAGGDRPKVAAPAPATRGGVDYALAVLGPLLGVLGGAYAFLLLTTAFDHAQSPVLPYTNPADIAQILMIPFVAAFKPLPIIVGLVVGLIVTYESLKMAPGTATRIMAGLTLLFTVLSVTPFILDASKLNERLNSDAAKRYKIPRGGQPDPRALELKLKADEFSLRTLRAIYKVDLDEGEIPPAWVSAAKDWAGDPKADEKIENENEKKVKCADVRLALQLCRELAPKYKADVEPIQAKLQALCDASVSADTQTLEDGWAKFEGRIRRDLAKPPKPKGAGAWFTAFDTWGDIGEVDPNKKDLPVNQKLYLGKLIHNAIKDLPPDMRFVGALRVSISPDYVAANEAEKLITRFNVCWVCYDLEKPDREPVIIPHPNGFLDDQRFKIEVLGEK